MHFLTGKQSGRTLNEKVFRLFLDHHQKYPKRLLLFIRGRSPEYEQIQHYEQNFVLDIQFH